MWFELDWVTNRKSSFLKRFLLILFVFLLIYAYISITLPSSLSVWAGDEISIDTFMPISVSVEESGMDTESVETIATDKGITFKTLENDLATHNVKAMVKLWGVVPLKQIDVNVVPKVELAPCGMASGIKMLTDGVMVVGMSDIVTEEGNANPAKKAGIHIKDVIVSVNGQSLTRLEDLIDIISKNEGKPLLFEIRRGRDILNFNIIPVLGTDGQYKIGLWVRDSAAGIGTVTFVDRKSKLFGGLGHAICDIDTGEVMSVSKGTLTRAIITQVEKGKRGEPGELKGYFDEDKPIGNLVENNTAGIFGIMNSDIMDSFKKSMPIALKKDIQEGDAVILTNVDKDIIEEYKIQIIKVNNGEDEERNMIIKVTDPRLIEKTGGIVQGMSGSPIIQNGKLIGAVTHVLVNDPSKGYGIFIENMLKNAADIPTSGIKRVAVAALHTLTPKINLKS